MGQKRSHVTLSLSLTKSHMFTQICQKRQLCSRMIIDCLKSLMSQTEFLNFSFSIAGYKVGDKLHKR